MGLFTKYGSSEHADTKTPQTDCYFGNEGKGEPHGHVAFDHDGNFAYGREADETPITSDQVSVPSDNK